MVEDMTRFKKRFSDIVHSKPPRVNEGKVCAHKSQEIKGCCSYVEKPICAKCG